MKSPPISGNFLHEHLAAPNNSLHPKLNFSLSMPVMPSKASLKAKLHVPLGGSKFHFEKLPAGVTAIDAKETQKLENVLESASDRLVIDHVINASSLSDELKAAVLDDSKKINVCLYDANSIDSQVLFQLYHMIRKFLDHKRFEISYVRGGFDNVSSCLHEKSPVASPPSPISPSTSNEAKSEKEKADLIDTRDGASPCSSTDSMPFLTGFSLPSATSADNKLLMSIKKNLSKLDTVTTYNYNFRFPKDFEAKKERLPGWLSFFAEIYGKDNCRQLIVERFNNMFDRLEKAEQARLRMAISNVDKNSELCHNLDRNLHENEGYGTPKALCPCCDKINYTIPKGVEYGHKNRYNNIWPYEHSRVHLVSSPSCTHRMEINDDYFNANYIAYKKLSQRRYIATQNPLAATKDDFWSTVWYNGVKSIVCLATAPVFGERPYYDHDQVLEKIKLSIKIAKTDMRGSFTLREIKLTKHDESRTVYHFAYEKWPDFGTPDELTSVFDLMQTKNEKLALMGGEKPSSVKTTQTWDLLVHCSAGCGRTGCFIAMDMVLDSFENPNKEDKHYDPWGDDDLVYKSVQFQRQQRISMVQNLDQFIFCYESILNYIVNNLID